MLVGDPAPRNTNVFFSKILVGNLLIKKNGASPPFCHYLTHLLIGIIKFVDVATLPNPSQVR